MLPYYQVATKLVMAGLVSNIYFIMQQGVCCSDRWECFIFSGFHVCLFTFFIYIHINFFFEFRFLSSRWTYQLYFSLSWTAHKLATLVWSYYSWISPPPPRFMIALTRLRSIYFVLWLLLEILTMAIVNPILTRRVLPNFHRGIECVSGY